jgi:hypothetical protein
MHKHGAYTGFPAVLDNILEQILGRNLDYFRANLGILWKNRKILGIQKLIKVYYT